jgi:glutathione S-transferase
LKPRFSTGRQLTLGALGSGTELHYVEVSSAPEAFAYLESLAPERYLVAGKLSIADLAVVSNLVMFHYLGHRIDTRYPKLARYFRAHLDTPVVAETLQHERGIVLQMNLDPVLFN